MMYIFFCKFIEMILYVYLLHKISFWSFLKKLLKKKYNLRLEFCLASQVVSCVTQFLILTACIIQVIIYDVYLLHKIYFWSSFFKKIVKKNSCVSNCVLHLRQCVSRRTNCVTRFLILTTCIEQQQFFLILILLIG